MPPSDSINLSRVLMNYNKKYVQLLISPGAYNYYANGIKITKQQQYTSSSTSFYNKFTSFSSCARVNVNDYDDDNLKPHFSYHNHNNFNNNHNDYHNSQHCETCSCPPPSPSSSSSKNTINKPKHSFYKRTLPSSLIALSSPQGKALLIKSISNNNAESYFTLIEQFLTQSDPTYCGLTTLAMVMNALQIDPKYLNWKGIWRWFDEEFLINTCCFLNERQVKESGITMEEFCIVGHCHGAGIVLKRPSSPSSSSTPSSSNEQNNKSNNDASIESFRNDIKEVLQSTNTFIVTSFNRKILSQTGTGHFSPIAAYDEDNDLVLILDVARFKYTPYWVKVDTLYQAMLCLDSATSLPRGWFLVSKIKDEEHCKMLAVSNNSSRILVKDHHKQKEHNHDTTTMNVTKDSNTTTNTTTLHDNKIIIPKFDNCRLRCDKKMSCSSKLCGL